MAPAGRCDKKKSKEGIKTQRGVQREAESGLGAQQPGYLTFFPLAALVSMPTVTHSGDEFCGARALPELCPGLQAAQNLARQGGFGFTPSNTSPACYSFFSRSAESSGFHKLIYATSATFKSSLFVFLS